MKSQRLLHQLLLLRDPTAAGACKGWGRAQSTVKSHLLAVAEVERERAKGGCWLLTRSTPSSVTYGEVERRERGEAAHCS